MATLRDIAEQVGVSIATVSRVLSGKESRIPISADTRNRVIEAARRLNYQANLEARRLRKGGRGTQTIGVIDCVSDGIGQHPFFAQFMAGIEEVVRTQGAQLLYRSFWSQGKELSTELLDTFVGGLHGAITLHSIPQPLRGKLLQYRLPVVAFEPYAELGAWPTFYLDYKVSMDSLASHLGEVGHRRVVFISHRLKGQQYEHPPFADRRRSFVESAKKHGIEVYSYLVNQKAGETDMDTGRRALLELLARRDDFSCVIAANDMFAFGVIGGARYAGLRVPKDLGVVGFDDVDTAAYMHPSLTTIRVERKALASTIVKHLFSLLTPHAAHNDLSALGTAPSIRFPTRLIIRESSRTGHSVEEDELPTGRMAVE